MNHIFRKNKNNNVKKLNKLQSRLKNDINNKKNNIIKYQKINYSNKKINSLIIFLIFSIIIKECSLPFPDYHSSIITIKINKNGTH